MDSPDIKKYNPQPNSIEDVFNKDRNFDKNKDWYRRKRRETTIAFKKLLQEKHPNKQFPDLWNLRNLDRNTKKMILREHNKEVRTLFSDLSLEEKTALVEEFSDDLDIDSGFGFSDLILNHREKRQRIIGSLKGKNMSNQELKEYLRKHFRVYEIVTAFGYDWRDESTKKILAKKAWINVEYNKKGRQNEKIASWLLDLALWLNGVYSKGASRLNEDHSVMLNKFAIDNGSKDLELAFRDIPDELIDKINSLSEKSFNEFLTILIQTWKEKSKHVEKSFWGLAVSPEMASFAISVVWNIAKLEMLEKNIIAEENKNLTKWMKEITKEDIDKEFIEYTKRRGIIFNNLSVSNKTAIRQEFLNDYIQKSKYLNDAQKVKYFNENRELSVELYSAWVAAWISFQEIRWEDYFQQIESEYIISQKSSTLERKVEMTSHNTESRNEFREQIKNNSSLWWDIVSKIPAFDVLKEEDQTLLLEETNDQIKSFFVDRVLLFIQDSLNITIDEQNKENILSQFDLEDWLKFENQEISFQWYAHWQLLELKYNMQTGELFHKPFMNSQWTDKEWNSAITFNSDYQVLANWPSLKSISYIANEDVNYSDFLEQSTEKESESNSLNMQKYSNLLFEQLDHKFPQKFIENKDLLKETYLQSILAQEMIDLAGITEIPASISKSTPIEHEFFKIIYQNTYHLNIDKKTEHLQKVRSLIARLRNTYEQGKNKLEKQADWAGNFEVNSKNLLHKLFDKRFLDKQNILSQETNPQRQKMKIWTDFLDNMSSRKKDKNILNPIYLRDFARWAEKPSSENQFSRSVVESMGSYFGDDLDRSLDKQLSEIT